MQFACIAALQDEETRCRNFVEVEVTPRGIGYFEEEEELMCSQHRARKEQGKKVVLAPYPAIILVRFKLNPVRTQKLVKAGIQLKPVQAVANEKRNIERAQEVRRAAYRYGQGKANSGVPVFGKEGLENVSISGLWAELLMQRYRVVDTHILDSQERMKMWVTSLALQDGEQEPINFPAEVYEFVGSCFGHCHVWANPPNEERKVVHTLNMSHRRSDTETEFELRFNNGLWAAVPFTKSARSE